MPKGNLHAHSAICQFRRVFLGLGQLPPGNQWHQKMMLSSLNPSSAFRKRDGAHAHSAVRWELLEILPQKLSPLSHPKVGIFCQKLIHLDSNKPQRISIPQPKMISKFVPMFFVLLLITVIISIFGQINGQRAHFIAQRGMAEANAVQNHPIRSLEGAVADRVENQLLGALELLQTYQEAKFAEKKRNNKFEFIRFGRRRR